jgi:hypothetical protein
LSVRSVRALRNGDEAVSGAGFDALIVRTEVLYVAETVSREQHAELFTLPAAHHELIFADALIAPPDKFVALRDQQESVFTIELRDTCEGQLSSIGGDPFSEEGLACMLDSFEWVVYETLVGAPRRIQSITSAG